MRSLMVAIMAITSIWIPSSVFAQAPDSLSFQGFLTDSLGNPIDQTGLGITFTLYKGGSAVWTEPQSVDVKDGVFNVLLGKVTDLSTLAFDQPMDLGIKLDSEVSEILPRTPLTAAAYAKALPGLYTFYREGLNYKGFNVVGGAAINIVGPLVTGATIGGGGGFELGNWKPNSVLGHFGTVSGGVDNTASGRISTIGGGGTNTASGILSTIGGGTGHQASEIFATIGGGAGHHASGKYATIGGGRSNLASGENSTVPGGISNNAQGFASFAAGSDARALHNGSFVWSDTTDAGSFVTTGNNQFLIRAAGGVGIGTNSPSSQLTVVGKADFDSVAIGSVNTKLKVDIAGGAWDLNATEGDFRIGTASNRLKIGVATSGLGAGRSAIRAQGTATPELRLGAEDVDVVIINKGDGLIPTATNTYSLGKSGSEWSEVWATSGVVSSSDRRLKQDIEDVEDGLNLLSVLRPVRYRWKSEPNGDLMLGLIAQEVEPIVPEVVRPPQNDAEHYGLNYAHLVPLLIKAIQEQQTQIDELLLANREQDMKVAALEARLRP